MLADSTFSPRKTNKSKPVAEFRKQPGNYEIGRVFTRDRMKIGPPKVIERDKTQLYIALLEVSLRYWNQPGGVGVIRINWAKKK